MPSEFHLIRVADKLEASSQTVDQLKAWAAGLPSRLEVRHHHLDCNAPRFGDQSRCNCCDGRARLFTPTHIRTPSYEP